MELQQRLVIGFGGKAGHGKDTCAGLMMAVLQRKRRYSRLDSFAHSLKDGIGGGVFLLNDAQLYGDQKLIEDPFWKLTPRRILQLAGTEAMRNAFGHDIWTRTLERRAAKLSDIDIIITDVRFPNEVDCIRRLGGCLILVERPVELLPEEFKADPRALEHLSETALEHFTGWDFKVQNDCGLHELAERIAAIVEELTR